LLCDNFRALQAVETTLVLRHTGRVRELLTPALAQSNPKAYIAHFKRLGDEAQRAHVATMTVEQLQVHFRTLGQLAAVGLFLTMPGARLEATVAGATLGEASGADAPGLHTKVLTLGRQLEASVSGMLVSSLELAAETHEALRALDWAAKTLMLAGDSGDEHTAPSLGWSMRGTIANAGTFYMPSQSLPWESRVEVETRLRTLAAEWNAVLDVRVV
jgi:hypothetical protein